VGLFVQRGIWVVGEREEQWVMEREEQWVVEREALGAVERFIY